MRRGILLGIVLFVGFVASAQNNYQICGKINGMTEGTLLLVTDEVGRVDTLNSTQIKNGFFMFEGRVNRPIAVYITLTNEDRIVPFILECTNITINVNNTGTLIQGGELQEIFNQFARVNVFLLQEQERIQNEFWQAEQVGDTSRMRSLTKQFERVITDARSRERVLLEKYSDTYVAALVVASGMYQLELDTLKARYALLSESARATVPGCSIAALISTWENIKEGNVAPDFMVSSLQGDSLSLHSVKSKLKLIHFWESSDAACRRDNVKLLDLYQRFHLKGLEIISVSSDKNEQVWVKAVNTDGMFWRNGLDRNLRTFYLYGVKTLPYTILLDEENHIIAKNLEIKVLQKKINELLKKK